MWDLEYYQKLTFSSRYFIWSIVYRHRPDHLVSSRPNKLLRPTGNDAIRHFLCIVSHHSNHLKKHCFDIGSGVTIWGFGVPGGEPHRTLTTRTYLVHVVALNTARDMGSRLMAITIWGMPGKLTLLSFILHFHKVIMMYSRWRYLRCHSGLNKHSCDFVSCLHLWVPPNWLWQRWVITGKTFEQYSTKLTSHSDLWMAYGLH